MQGSMRERSPGRWELRVFLGNDPVTGKKQYVSRSVMGGKRLASSELAKLVAAEPGAVKPQRRGQAKMTLSELIDEHIERHPGSPTTLTEYRAAHNRYIRPLVGRLPIAELDAGTLDHFYEHLVRKRGLSSSTVRQVHAIIRGACSRAVKWGWLKSNPARDASPPTVRRREPDIPSAAAVAAAIRAAEETNPPFGLFLRLAAATGGRRGELCSLTWAHVSLEDSTLRIEMSTFSERGGNSVVKDTKNHSKRVVSLDTATTQSLAEHQKLMAERASVCGQELTDRSFVFSNDADGQTPWRPDYVTGAWTRLRKPLGLDHVRLHDLRHFQATMLLQSGIPVKDVSKRIGHRDAATTLNVDAHVLGSTGQRDPKRAGSGTAIQPLQWVQHAPTDDTVANMPRVIQIRDVPDDVHDALADAAQAQGLSLTRYMLRELEHLAKGAQAVHANAAVIRKTQAKVRGHVDRDTILTALHEGRGD